MKLISKGYWLGTVESFQNAEAQAHKQLAPVSLRDIHAAKATSKVKLDSSGQFDDDEEDDGILDVSYMTEVKDGIGIIRIDGTLTNDYSFANHYWGEVSYEEVAAAASQMAADPNVKAVILDISSPGGDANGIERGSSAIDALAKAKPTYSFTSGMMCSAAYWLGCGGRQVWASSLATVGSIGVVAIHKSYEKMMAKEGVTVTVMRQGQYKMLLNPYEDITPEAQGMMEAQMEIIYGMFLGHVSDKRGIPVPKLASGPAQGQTFLGVQAVETGLIDQVGDFTRLVNQLRSKYASQAAGSAGNFNMSDRGLSMKIFDRGGKKFALNARGQAAVAAGLSEDDAGANEEFLEEVVEKSAEELAAEQAAAAADAAAADAAEAADAVAKAQAAAAASATASAGDGTAMIQMTNRIVEEATKNAALSAELAKLQSEVEVLKTNNAGLRRVSMASINRMEVAMNMAPSKQEDFDSDSTVVAKFNRLESDFNGRYKPGAKAEHSNGEQGSAGTAAKASDSTLVKSAQNLTKLS